MYFLFLFIDGLGLGQDDPESNPLANAVMPNITNLLEGRKLVRDSIGKNGEPFITKYATLHAIDPILGVEGYPQSATGQATILTGINIPKILGYHFGPKPNPEIKHLLEEGTIFHVLTQRGYHVALLNGYPQSYFDHMNTGRRLPGAIAMAVKLAGIPLKNTDNMKAGQALSADLTGQGWRDRLNIQGIPIYSPTESGTQLAKLTLEYDFAFFEYWLSDYAGHRADMEQSCQLLEMFDEMLGGLIEGLKDSKGLILLTSDHGNMEDITTRRHTRNPVPGLVIGPQFLRDQFVIGLKTLADITPAIYNFYDQEPFSG